MIFGRVTEPVHIYIYEWIVSEQKEVLRGKYMTNVMPEIGDFVKTEKGKAKVIEQGICTPDGSSMFYPYILVKKDNPEYRSEYH